MPPLQVGWDGVQARVNCDSISPAMKSSIEQRRFTLVVAILRGSTVLPITWSYGSVDAPNLASKPTADHAWVYVGLPLFPICNIELESTVVPENST